MCACCGSCLRAFGRLKWRSAYKRRYYVRRLRFRNPSCVGQGRYQQATRCRRGVDGGRWSTVWSADAFRCCCGASFRAVGISQMTFQLRRAWQRVLKNSQGSAVSHLKAPQSRFRYRDDWQAAVWYRNSLNLRYDSSQSWLPLLASTPL